MDTVCAVIHEALRARVASVDPVNLAYGTNTSLLELVALVEAELGHRVERCFTDARVGDVRASQADGSRVRALFPDVRPVSLEAGLESTMRWFRTERARGVT